MALAYLVSPPEQTIPQKQWYDICLHITCKKDQQYNRCVCHAVIFLGSKHSCNGNERWDIRDPMARRVRINNMYRLFRIAWPTCNNAARVLRAEESRIASMTAQMTDAMRAQQQLHTCSFGTCGKLLPENCFLGRL